MYVETIWRLNNLIRLTSINVCRDDLKAKFTLFLEPLLSRERHILLTYKSSYKVSYFVICYASLAVYLHIYKYMAVATRSHISWYATHLWQFTYIFINTWQYENLHLTNAELDEASIQESFNLRNWTARRILWRN